METLNQDVSELTKGLHHIMHILQAHVSVHHCKSSLPSYPYSIQMMSMPATVPSANLPLDQPSASTLSSAPISHVACSLQITPPYHDHWSCSETPKTQPESFHQPRTSTSRPGPSATSGSQKGSCCASESNSSDIWTSMSPRSISSGFQDGNPGLASQTGHENSDYRPVGLSTSATIGKSQPTLCLQPPTDEQSCLLFDAPAGLSTRSLLDASPTSYPPLHLPSETEVKLSPAIQEDICVLLSTPASNSLVQDTSIFQISDSQPFILPVSASATPPVLPVEPILGAGSPQLDTPEPHLPLGDPSSMDHNSLECLLGNGGSLESRDSESVSSQRSSLGLQTQSSEQSWCLDLTDWICDSSQRFTCCCRWFMCSECPCFVSWVSNSCQTPQNFHHFYAKAWHFEHLLHCVSFKSSKAMGSSIYCIFLNILRAVCSWYLLPSCMVKLLILFPKEKLSSSMCTHSTWQPFKCAHRCCVFKAERFGNGQCIKMESKSVTCFSVHGIEHGPHAALIVMPVYLNFVPKSKTSQYRKTF